MSYVTDVMQRNALVHDTMSHMARELTVRSRQHDRTMLGTPEREKFEDSYKITQKLEPIYDPDTFDCRIGLANGAYMDHFTANDHHPEHFNYGIIDMDLFQLMEFVADIMAYADTTDTELSVLLKNMKDWYHMSDQVYNLIINTIKHTKEILR